MGYIPVSVQWFAELATTVRGLELKTIDSSELRDNFERVLDSVGYGETYLIMRDGKSVAQLTSPQSDTVRFPDRSDLRASVPSSDEDSAQALRTQRDNERY